MPRLTEARRQDRREVLLLAAADTFSAQGYESASISAIARTAGVSDGLLYRYFTDKRELLAAVLERFLDEIIVLAEAAVKATSGFEAQLAALMQANLSVYARQPEMCRVFIRQGREAAGFRGSPLQQRIRRYTDLLRTVVHDAVENGQAQPWLDERLVRDFIFGGMEHLAWRTLATNEVPDLSARATELAQMLVRGMGR